MQGLRARGAAQHSLPLTRRSGRRTLLLPQASTRARTASNADLQGATNDAESRKHVDLYEGLKAVPSALPQHPNPAAVTPPAAAPVPADSEPAVSYLVSSRNSGNHASSNAGASGAVSSPGAAAAARRGWVKPEVLAPTGGWPQLRAAVENGADAVYFGLEVFNARARAANFTLEELPEVMAFLRARGVKGFVALNVLTFDSELEAMEGVGRAMAEAGVDAAIVQDWGVVALLRRAAPGLPIHGSTQMSITSPEGAAWVAGLGVERVVVGRELSVREIQQVRSGVPGTEVEAFVHGALCVSYSGQCFSSEAWGGRSANRGQCAQACRLPYGLLVDGIIRELGSTRYLLSPQDLMAVEQVPDLIRAGVACFKIEGRLKGPEYVSLTTQMYRKAVDAAWEAMCAEAAAEDAAAAAAGAAAGAGPRATTAAAAAAAVALTEQQRWDLEQVFARGQDGSFRGLTPGFLEGPRHQRLVRGLAPRHRGVFLGEVEAVGPRGVTLRLQAPLKRGDGVAFDAGAPEQDEPGGPVYDIAVLSDSQQQGGGGGGSGGGGGGGADNAPVQPGTRVMVSLGPQSSETLRRIAPGDRVWRTKDPALESRLRASFESVASAAARRLPVAVSVWGRAGEPLRLRLTDPEGCSVEAASGMVLQAAEKRGLEAEQVAKAVGPTLGVEALAVAGEVDVSGLDLAAGLFLPAGEIKAVRRAAVESLLAARARHRRDEGLAPERVLPGLLAEARSQPAPPSALALLEALSVTGTDAARGPDGQEEAGSSAARAGRERPAVERGVCLRVLCRSREQVDAALKVPWLKEVVVDFLEVLGLKEAVAAIRASGRRVVVATPRVLKPDEQRLWLFYLRLGADALLVRSAGMLHTLQLLGGPGARVPDVPYPIPALEGDFSLNAANAISASLLLAAPSGSPSGAAAASSSSSGSGAVGNNGSSATSDGAGAEAGPGSPSVSGSDGDGGVWRGLSRLAPTYDLHAGQLAALAAGLGPRGALLEAVAHQHLPIFHTEHCVFARFLSEGDSYKDCGHPCERHRLHLRDDKGADHLVLADMGCRNTVFNAKAQSGVFHLRDLLRAGFRTVRVELVDEAPEAVAPLLEGYRDVILGRRGPGDLWRYLSTLPDANGNAHGVDAGSLAPAQERARGAMKPTAAALKQRQEAHPPRPQTQQGQAQAQGLREREARQQGKPGAERQREREQPARAPREEQGRRPRAAQPQQKSSQGRGQGQGQGQGQAPQQRQGGGRGGGGAGTGRR
ncbi:hypothetical protein HYH03_005358 [Edaphochlamys debaryana]|uniref:Peptidase U32 collagenase domain-containing protein n=1 Tax=Edaphochlamys debaryana TaxID=47281 RepID=A0A835YF94_9CHLO|nr:hypothetical protein HYH03_005358 [Edaphochlamys debaryana]|eukprot:KAG2496534.1 hypothetical protein HYH03_005358 [Edaphochlamys debaryana]